ncbi:hypothetical protein N8457_00100 [bacterium]|nr:hypothetical protein [bacterium]
MDINKIADQIAAEEDFESRVYIDTQGFPTIGFGEKLSDKKYPVSDEGVAQARKDLGNPTVSKEEAKVKMIQYIKATAIPDAQNFIGEEFNNLSPQVQTATISLAYNVGGGGINQFSALRDSLKNNDLKGASQSLMGSLAGVQALFRYAEIIEKSFGKENMPTPEELKANPRAAELLNFIHGRKVLGNSIPKVFEQYIDNDRIEGSTVIDFLPENLQQIYNANGGGTEGAKAVQQELGVKDDGIIGPGTLRKALEDERRGKAGSYSKQEIEEDEVSFNVSEEEKEEPSFFDNIKDFFGISAEASDVPPVKTLEQPQEEVPMSPTDAMRAQSQGRVVLDSMQSVPTNPEAGPSDTVPAMLTPGEAVIPAAAAQDPENIPVIEKMIDEGRAKNRMAEANGIPVNGREAIMYDDAELDAYHKRNKTGKYGGGEMSLQGFAGGVMEVPSMMMMAPPKDPAMDQMEKLAVKQMGYEQKSKNRTRDTIEKIGLKHLEDTADANMKQAALDETMKNYGMEVPMPMQPVPQGFQDGSSYATEGSLDQTGLRGMQNLLVNSGVATPAEAFVDPEYAAREKRLAELEAEAQAQKEQEALYAQESAREANLALAAEQEALASDPTADPVRRQRAQAKVAQLQQAVPPVQAPQVAQVAVEEDKKPAPRPDPKDPDDDGDEEEGFLATLGKGISAAFKSVFDPESIATAGIYYGVNRLLGYDNETAAQQAAAGYNIGQKNRLAKLEYARKMGLEGVEDARQRDEQANENIGKLSTFISSQLDDEISDETLTEAGLSRADVANRVNMMVQGRGLDLSTTKGLNAARTLATRVTANYAKRVNAGLEASPEEEFDRVLLSQYELTQALTDDDGKPLSETATRGSFDKIRRNVAADRGVKEDEAQFVFEDRVNQAYQIFTNPANADRIQALRDQGRLTPGPGENEFSLFLAYVLKDKDSRVRQF